MVLNDGVYVCISDNYILFAVCQNLEIIKWVLF